MLRTSSNLGADIVSYGFKYRIHYEVEVSNNSSASLHAVEVDKHYFYSFNSASCNMLEKMPSRSFTFVLT